MTKATGSLTCAGPPAVGAVVQGRESRHAAPPGESLTRPTSMRVQVGDWAFELAPPFEPFRAN
jgi:hypothetical protein